MVFCPLKYLGCLWSLGTKGKDGIEVVAGTGWCLLITSIGLGVMMVVSIKSAVFETFVGIR